MARRRNSPPALPFFVTDFLGDYRVRRMSGEATAVYALLLLNMWESKTKYSVPDDDRLIANMLRIGRERWLQLKPEIMWEGDPCLIQRNGHLASRRLKLELVKLRNYQKKQSENGKKGGRPRKSPAEPGSNPGLSPPSHPSPNPGSFKTGLGPGFKGRIVRIPAPALGRLSSRYPELDLQAELRAMDRKAGEDPAFGRKKDWVLAAHAWLRKARTNRVHPRGGRLGPEGMSPPGPEDLEVERLVKETLLKGRAGRDR